MSAINTFMHSFNYAMKMLFTVMTTVLTIQAACAQNYFKSKDEVATYAENITTLFKEQDFSKAFTELRKYWPISEEEIRQMESQTKEQFEIVSERFGAIVGTDFVKEKLAKDFAIKRIHVIKFEKHIIRLDFTFYKSDKGWLLNAFRWDDQMGELFD